MEAAARLALETLLYTRISEHALKPEETQQHADAATPTPTAAWSWSARLADDTLSTYRTGGLPGRPQARRAPLDRPRTFYRSARAPKRWDPAEPRTKRPRPPSAPAPRQPAAAAAPAAAARSTWVDTNSHREHARSVYACKPVLPQSASARIFHSADPEELGVGAPRPALSLREPMGATLHGEWVGCHPGFVKHRGGWGSAPGWVDYSREAACVPSKARVRRTSAAEARAPPPPSRGRRRRHGGASRRAAPGESAQQQPPPHAVLQYDAWELQTMLTVGAEKLRSEAKARRQMALGRLAAETAERELDAVIRIQARWRGGRDRKACDERLWGAVIVQANFHAHKHRRGYLLKRSASVKIQKHARGLIARKAMVRMREAAICVQARFRGWNSRRKRREKLARESELLATLRRAEEAAASRMQAVYRGMIGRRKARTQRLRNMDAQQRLTEMERQHNAKVSEQMMKRQAVAWKQQQDEEAKMRQLETERAAAERLERSMMGPGDTGAVVRVTTRGAPGYGTFVAAFGLNKKSNWVEESKGSFGQGGSFRGRRKAAPAAVETE